MTQPMLGVQTAKHRLIPRTERANELGKPQNVRQNRSGEGWGGAEKQLEGSSGVRLQQQLRNEEGKQTPHPTL